MDDRLIVALDYPGLAPALELVQELSGIVSTFKVGLELFTVMGPQGVEQLQRAGARIFLDLKFHDIGATMAGACRAAAGLGVWMLNVHLVAGREGVRLGVQAARRASPSPLVIGVTVLTSLDQGVLRDEIGVGRSLPEQVLALAGMAQEEGLDGVVASPLEVAVIKERCGGRFLTVVPGIRPASAAADDQRRTATPAQAIRLGADYLVVGRPITASPDPVLAAKAILADIKGARVE